MRVIHSVILGQHQTVGPIKIVHPMQIEESMFFNWKNSENYIQLMICDDSKL